MYRIGLYLITSVITLVCQNITAMDKKSKDSAPAAPVHVPRRLLHAIILEAGLGLDAKTAIIAEDILTAAEMGDQRAKQLIKKAEEQPVQSERLFSIKETVALSGTLVGAGCVIAHRVDARWAAAGMLGVATAIYAVKKHADTRNKKIQEERALRKYIKHTRALEDDLRDKLGCGVQ